MNYYIYQRISTKKQELLRQQDSISDYCRDNNIVVPEENIFSDIYTGKTFKRDNYKKMKSLLAKDDVLIILDLDRLGRNWDAIKNEWEQLTKRGVYIIVVNCPLINVLPNPNGEISLDRRLIQEMMFTLLCYVSQKEVEKISERTKSALKAKRNIGVVLGRPTNLTQSDREGIIQDRKNGMRVCDIIEKYHTNKGTVNKILSDAGLVNKQRKGLCWETIK